VRDVAEGAGWRVVVRGPGVPSELEAAIRELQPSVVFADRLPELDADEPSSLRWIQLATTGVDQMLDAAIWGDPRVIITTSKGVQSPSMAQYVVLGVLWAAHRMYLATTFRSERDFSAIRPRMAARLVEGRTIGFLGYGDTAQRAGRALQALGMRTIGIGSGASMAPSPAARDAPHESWDLDRLDELVRTVDVLAVTAPLTRRTRGLLSAQRLAMARPGIVVINVSRGPIIDESALIQALRDGIVSAAVLDVFEHEPLPPESPLWAMDNVLLTPHVSGLHEARDERLIDLCLDNLARFRRGAPLRNVADPQRGY
jgi:phosphoglycerate dehydrogenase-like enzyme